MTSLKTILVAATLAACLSRCARAGDLTATNTSACQQPTAEQLQCGGVINVTTEEIAYFEYKLGQQIVGNQFCIWVIVSTGEAWGTAAITVEENGFEADTDGIEGYYIYESSVDYYDFAKEPKEDAFEEWAWPCCALSIGPTSRGTGFRMNIETASRSYGNTAAFFTDETERKFRYPVDGGSYNQSERVLAIFQPNQPNSPELSLLDTQAYNDYVIFYSIPPYSLHSNAIYNGAWSGSYPTGVQASLSYSNCPRVALFTSSYSIHGTGFEITYGLPPPPTTTTTMAPSPILECGGVIEFSSPAELIVEYKADESYSNNESCIWALHAKNLWEKITVTIESEGFETGRDGVDAYYINTTTGYQSTEYVGFNKCSLSRVGDSCALENGIGFLAFSSDSANEGVGFLARMVAEDTFNEAIDSANFFDTKQGSFQYPINIGGYDNVYENHERKLMIFQLENDNSNYLEVASIQTEQLGDYLHFFSIHPFHRKEETTNDFRFSGDYPQGSADAISFGDGPRIALFLSDDYDTNYGFTVNWEEAPFSGGRNDQHSSPSLRTSHALANAPN